MGQNGNKKCLKLRSLTSDRGRSQIVVTQRKAEKLLGQVGAGGDGEDGDADAQLRVGPPLLDALLVLEVLWRVAVDDVELDGGDLEEAGRLGCHVVDGTVNAQKRFLVKKRFSGHEKIQDVQLQMVDRMINEIRTRALYYKTLRISFYGKLEFCGENLCKNFLRNHSSVK